jgi:hypothetical protein
MRLEQLAEEIVEESGLALRGRHELLGHLSEPQRRELQCVKAMCAEAAIHVALQILAMGARAPGPPTPDELDREFDRLTDQLVIGWATLERFHSAKLDAELRAVADGDNAA